MRSTCLLFIEIPSAYSTVRLNQEFLGLKTFFSEQFRTISKLIIITIKTQGQHRGLLHGLERAILRPSQSLHEKGNEDVKSRARCTTIEAEICIDGFT